MFTHTHSTYNTLPTISITIRITIFYIYTSLYTPPRDSPDSHSFSVIRSSSRSTYKRSNQVLEKLNHFTWSTKASDLLEYWWKDWLFSYIDPKSNTSPPVCHLKHLTYFFLILLFSNVLFFRGRNWSMTAGMGFKSVNGPILPLWSLWFLGFPAEED